MSEITVRVAVPGDEEGLMWLARELHDENGMFPLNQAKVRSMVDRAVAREHAIIGIIGEPGEEPKGSIYLLMCQMWYSDTWFLDEMWNFVHPKYRPPALTGCAQALLSFAKKCSDDIQIPLMVGILSTHRTEAKIRLYERQLTKAGAFFVHNRDLTGLGHGQ